MISYLLCEISILSLSLYNFLQNICSTMISSHVEILENIPPEAVDADEKERHDAVNTAIEWIEESLNELLKGLQPTDQYKVDELLGYVYVFILFIT